MAKTGLRVTDSKESQVKLGTMTVPDAQYESIFEDVSKIIAVARQSAVRSINALMTASYWLIGRRIVEFEQEGGERAEYGTALIERLAVELTSKFGRGFSRQNLQLMRLFYRTYSCVKICQTASGKFTFATTEDHIQGLLPSFPLP